MSYYKSNYCAYCGDYSGKYELCSECYYMAQDEVIIKNEKGKWIKNIRLGNEYKFFDKNKTYRLKDNLLNEYEMRFFEIAKDYLSKKYTIVPQVNLQSIIETDTNTRNDELFRNVDFMLFHSKEHIPFLAIELNGEQHYTNDYWIERDKSVKQILDRVSIPLLTITIKDLKRMDDREVGFLIEKVVKYLNPGLLNRLLKKENNKMDLSWTKELMRGA